MGGNKPTIRKRVGNQAFLRGDNRHWNTYRVAGIVVRRLGCCPLREMTGIDDLIWHGLRSVMGTRLPELGVAPHIVRYTLDHAAYSAGTKKLPARHLETEVLAAFELWCDHVEGLVPADAKAAVLK